MTITIIGTGLIGGSLAIALKEKKLAERIIGVERDPAHAKTALELGLVDEINVIEEAIPKSDVIIIAVPVSVANNMIVSLLDQTDRQIVIDAGSTKMAICKSADKSKNRKRFVATHPMWGTEFSGPAAAVRGAFAGNAVVICDKDNSDAEA